MYSSKLLVELGYGAFFVCHLPFFTFFSSVWSIGFQALGQSQGFRSGAQLWQASADTDHNFCLQGLRTFVATDYRPGLSTPGPVRYPASTNETWSPYPDVGMVCLTSCRGNSGSSWFIAAFSHPIQVQPPCSQFQLQMNPEQCLTICNSLQFWDRQKVRNNLISSPIDCWK